MCIYFIGMAISENILDAIYKSRKVIVVLSQNFMKSMWGQFELSQALNRAVIQVIMFFDFGLPLILKIFVYLGIIQVVLCSKYG